MMKPYVMLLLQFLSIYGLLNIECFVLLSEKRETANDYLPLNNLVLENRHKNVDCYWGIGETYDGTVNYTVSNRLCLKWSDLNNIQIDYPELRGGHSYCRNPGGNERQLWCYVDVNNKVQQESCDVMKCVDKISTYMAMTFVLSVVLIFALACYWACFRKIKKKQKLFNISLESGEMIFGSSYDDSIFDNRRDTSQPATTSLLCASASAKSGDNDATTPRTGTSNIIVPTKFSIAQSVLWYPIRNITFIEELGKGNFSRVYKGKLDPMLGGKHQESRYVAVKFLKKHAKLKTENEFKREINITDGLQHPNIICILGVVLKGKMMGMLLEYMSKGNLRTFLIDHSLHFNALKNNKTGKILDQRELLYIALQIASGMEYLARNRLVHRDLAARNCLVGKHLTIKISDFGLSRDIYHDDYYRIQSSSIPLRWMPPEAIFYNKFTTKSDVWSFGIVLWELYSYGLYPYYGYNNREVIDMIHSRQLLPCPKDCSISIHSLMIACWHEATSRRPQFYEIHHRLHNFYVNMTYLTSQKIKNKTDSPPIYNNNNSLNRKDLISKNKQEAKLRRKSV